MWADACERTFVPDKKELALSDVKRLWQRLKYDAAGKTCWGMFTEREENLASFWVMCPPPDWPDAYIVDVRDHKVVSLCPFCPNFPVADISISTPTSTNVACVRHANQGPMIPRFWMSMACPKLWSLGPAHSLPWIAGALISNKWRTKQSTVTQEPCVSGCYMRTSNARILLTSQGIIVSRAAFRNGTAKPCPPGSCGHQMAPDLRTTDCMSRNVERESRCLGPLAPGARHRILGP